MGHEPNELPLVNSLDQLTPVLRRELEIRPQMFGGKQCFVVEDPVSARFFRIGQAEHAFISRLDGRKTIGEALEETRRSRPDCAFSPTDALSICQWVTRSGLVRDESVDAAAALATRQENSGGRRGGRISPLSIQIPLFHPDRFFQQLTPWFSWMFSVYALVGWLFVAGWAVRDLVVHYHRLTADTSGIFAVDNWFWLAVVWLVLKMLHECGHAVACKRFGGEVREAGVIFILLAPLAYVDVTSSWRLRSKWDRIAVAAAGMYVELFIAAVATLVWVRVAPGAVSQICLNVMMTASIMTVLFNANPLMRFDGYYMLSDFLEMPNLYASGQLYVRHFVRRYLFGMPSVSSAGTGLRAGFIRLYGILSWVWRSLVFFGLVLTAATMLEGAGIVISVLALLVWSISLLRRLNRFIRTESNGRASWTRFAFVGGGLATATALVVTSVPWPGSITAPAVVEYAPEIVVRTECDGFVTKVRAEGGKHVEEGQILIEMTNVELEQELEELRLKIDQSVVQRRIHQRQSELAKAQAELEQLKTLEQQYAEKREELKHLVVRAPAAGKIIGRKLDDLVGTYQTKGARLLSIGDEAAKQVRLSIAQQDMSEYRDRAGTTMRVFFSGTDYMKAPLQEVEPQASLKPLAASLCAPNGGSLPVRDVDADQEESGQQPYELLSPRFAGTVRLNASQSQRVRAGQRARVALRGGETVGEHIYRWITDWIDSKLRRKNYRVVVATDR